MELNEALKLLNNPYELKVERSKQYGIGGSDISVICNLNPHKSKIHLWMEKTGKQEPEDLSNNKLVKAGTLLERFVIENYFKPEHPEYEVFYPDVTFLGNETWKKANLDGLLYHKERGFGALDVKTGRDMSKQFWQDEDKNLVVKDMYELQAEWYYHCIPQIKYFIFPVFLGGYDYFEIETERKQDIIDAMLPIINQFWQDVVDKTIPEIDGRECTTNALKLLYPEATKEEPMILDFENDIEEKINQYLNIKANISELEKQKDLFENEFKAKIADFEIATYKNTYEIKYPNYEKKSYDTKLLIELYPEIAKQIEKTTKYRMFSVKPIKQKKEKK